MPKGKNTKEFRMYYDPENWSRCKKRAEAEGLKTGTYIRRIAVNGKVIRYDLGKYDLMQKALMSASGCFNQIAAAVNSTGEVTEKDIEVISDYIEMLKNDCDLYFKDYEYDLL